MRGPRDVETKNPTYLYPHSLLCTSIWLFFSIVFVNMALVFQETQAQEEKGCK